MIRKQGGFSLVELMVAVVVFVFAITAATAIFIPLVNQFKQQSKIAETNTEGIIGLEILRVDLENAGFGLPWYFPNNTINYSEASVGQAMLFNDAPGNAPRAILTGNNVAGFTGVLNNTDYLVIKSTAVTGSDAAQRWTYIVTENEPTPTAWASEALASPNKVIVIKPKVSDTRLRELVMDGSTFFTQFSPAFPANFSPVKPSEAYLIYGVDADTNLRMPFNRADYYVGIPAPPAVMPQRCAAGTGILQKATLTQRDGVLNTPLPLLDCVADMQVAYGIDQTGDGAVTCYTNNLAAVFAPPDARNIRNRVKEVRVYVLAHEGQADRFFNFIPPGPPVPPNSIRVGEGGVPICTGGGILGRDFDFVANGIANWQRYRWKVYTLVVKPQNLR